MEQGVAVRVAPRLKINLWLVLSYIVLGLAALLPRVLQLGLFITDDEANFWLTRSDIFLRALRSGDFAATAITAHPGVTTMWLGASGILLRHSLFAAHILHSDAFPVVLACMRLPVVLVHSLVILLGYRLLQRMFTPMLAFLAALLWAADPFVVGYSKLLHTDALAGSFMVLSVLAACVYWNHHDGKRWLITSALSAGLAVLSKSPALVLLPVIGFIAWWSASTQQLSVARLFTRSFWLPLLAWAALAALTVFAFWPALWVSPLAAYQQIRIGVEIEGAQPHMLGNFFLGRADDAPGLLYYPAALALRTTPWTLFGILLLPLAWRRAWPQAYRRDLACLAGYIVLFILAMSLFPKKFDRYIEPAFPVFDILATIGLFGALERIASSQQQLNMALTRALVFVLTLAALVNIAWWHPYSISAFNQMLGGTATGAHVFTVGWGEGLEQVADWLNQQPDITSVRTVSLRITSLNPYLREGAQAMFPKGNQLRPKTGYVVVYLPQTQTGQADGAFAQFYPQSEPVHVVKINGVDYAWIYRAPPDIEQARSASFGHTIQFYGFNVTSAPQRGQTMQLQLVWNTQTQPDRDYWLFAHLIGPNAQQYSQIDLPTSSSQWSPGDFKLTDLPLVIPVDAPAGHYQLLIGLYSMENNQRLPLSGVDAASANEPNAFLLTEFDLQ